MFQYPLLIFTFSILLAGMIHLGFAIRYRTNSSAEEACCLAGTTASFAQINGSLHFRVLIRGDSWHC